MHPYCRSASTCGNTTRIEPDRGVLPLHRYLDLPICGCQPLPALSESAGIATDLQAPPTIDNAALALAIARRRLRGATALA